MNTPNPQQPGADDWRATPPGTRLPREGRFSERGPIAWLSALAIAAGVFAALIGIIFIADSVPGGWAILILGVLAAGIGAVLHVLRGIGAEAERRE